jgi:hypothetical protein
MAEISNEDLAQAVTSPRFAALSQTNVALDDLAHYDVRLLREPRLLVPVDVQALVVRSGDEPMVRLPFRDGGDALPAIDDPGSVRAPGVHLLWTTPAAFGRGNVVPDPAAPNDKARRLLDLPVLPDRWVVIRLVIPNGAGGQPVARGWVLEADEATVTPLAEYPAKTNAVSVGTAVPAERLTVHVGGPLWTVCYDAALGRHAFHDPIDDLGTIAPSGLVGDAISYVVAGWWSDPRHDPLDGIGSLLGYHRRLDELGWDDPDHPAPDGPASQTARSERAVSRIFGIERATRHRATPGAFELYPNSSPFVHEAIAAAVAPKAPTRSTMLHGRIHGVPWKTTQRPDDRPKPTHVKVALGPTGPAVSAVLASGALTNGDAKAQRDAERLLTAFSAGLLDRIEQPDAWPDIEQYEHAQGFASQPGGVEAVDHLVDRPSRGNDPGASFRRGRRSKLQGYTMEVADTIMWSLEKVPVVAKGVIKPKAAGGGPQVSAAMNQPVSSASAASLYTQEVTRNVARPAPPYQTPIAPVLAVVGAGRRLLAAQRDEADGILRVRTSDQPVRGLKGLFDADKLLRSIGSGAVPDEVKVVVREALAEDPYLVSWRSNIPNVGDASGSTGPAQARMHSEAAINYAYYAGDDTRLSTYVGATVDSSATRQTAVEGLLAHSLVDGVWSHPEGVTMWGQPWRPLFCEWAVELDLAALGDLGAWTLEEIDLERDDAFSGGQTITVTGRSPLVTGAAGTLGAAVERWIDDERKRDNVGHGLASEEVEKAMVGLRDHLANLDVLSVTFDGIRETLLGLQYDRGLLRTAGTVAADGKAGAVAIALPRLVAAGALRLTAARLVDSFGRTLELPVTNAIVAARSDTTAPGATMHLRPRVTAPTRLHLRLVDPLAIKGPATTAFVDQEHPADQVNPVAGFLLPDHIDEALEFFATDGTPLGQISHDPFSDAVFWEGAPGRTDIGPGAGPLDDPDVSRQRLGWIASALVAVDAEARQATPDRPETESPLSALLRAIDTTLWTVDPLGSMGREHIAGLVGRPIAVVTARLTLDVLTDLDQLVYDAGASREAREQAFAELAAVPFEVRLGCATRGDDGLLGYFVDDDYTRFSVIDHVIATHARDAGRCRGDLGVTGQGNQLAIDHPYVVTDGTVTIRHGQTLRLTLLMHPGGKVHLTSGVVPRLSVALARDWVQPGLSVIAPSVRCGPLLIDADKVRLPKVASFPADQLFTRRDSPGSWRDDPILAATQSAYLPDEASTVQEGWIRIAPQTDSDEGG